MSWVSEIVSANREDSVVLGPSWRTNKAPDAVCSGSLTKWLAGRTGPELETVAVEPDVSASGTWAESNWLTGTCRLEMTGGTDMVEGRPRQTKTYNVSVSIKVNTHLAKDITLCWYSIKQSSACSWQSLTVQHHPQLCSNSKLQWTVKYQRSRSNTEIPIPIIPIPQNFFVALYKQNSAKGAWQ